MHFNQPHLPSSGNHFSPRLRNAPPASRGGGYRYFSGENSMVAGKQVEGCWGNEGVGKMKKGFFPSYFFPNPQFLCFFPNSLFFSL